MLTKGAIGNLVNRYRAVLKKCHLINIFGSLVVAGMLVIAGASAVKAEVIELDNVKIISSNISYNDTQTTINYDIPAKQMYFPTEATIFKITNNSEVSFQSLTLNAINNKRADSVQGIYVQSNQKCKLTGNTLIVNIEDTYTRKDHTSNGIHTLSGVNCNLNINSLKISVKSYANNGIFLDSGVGNVSFNGNDLHIQSNGIGAANGIKNFYGNFEAFYKNCVITAESKNENARGIFASSGSKTILNGSTTIKAVSKSNQRGIALDANMSSIQVGLSDKDGKSAPVTTIIDGHIKSYSGSTIDVGLTNSRSHFIGYTDGPGIINLTMKKDALWDMDYRFGGSHITTFKMDSGIVNMQYDESLGSTLKIDTLTGENGLFKVDTDIDADETDQIIIGTGSGSHKIDVHATGEEPSRKAMESFIVQQNEGNASFSLANQGGMVDYGNYLYELAERTNEDDKQEWYLRRVENPAPVDPDDPTPPVNPNPPLSPTGETEAALSGLAGHYAMWYGQLTDLRKRLGEVRYGTQTGLWVRGFADKSRLDGLGGTSFTQNMFGGSIGYDTLASVSEESLWLVGMQLRSARAHQSVNGHWGGHGDLTSVGGGLYSTWAHADGWYVDAVGTMDWYNHKLRTSMLDGTRVHDDRSSYGLGASLEAGRKLDFAFSNEGRDYWFLEPQLQLSYFWVKGGDFHTSNGMKIEQKDMDSLTGRAGLVLGKKFSLEGGSGERYVQPYVKAGVNHEFLGEQEARINGVRMTSDLDGTRVYYGAGVDWQATDNLRLYMQAEREHGEHFTREYNVSAGLKWKF